jgi:hypothetical protein
MFKRNLMSLAFGAVLATGAVSAYALAPSMTGDLAREAAEGPRGADNERPGDRQRRGGRGLTTDSPADPVIARSKPRVPGGSGCDDPRDLIEHPECNVPKATIDSDRLARSKPRVPGGSGCDDPRDLIEHPECNVPKNTLPEIELVAREASEGPRGADNERPGDRQRRGGRG